MSTCIFCEIVAGRAPATIVGRTPTTLLIVPLGPVVDGHVLALPQKHVADAAEDLTVTADVMADVAAWAGHQRRPFNLITSAGREATQTVFHLHVHYVPRAAGDGLALPWTGQRGTVEAGTPDDAARAACPHCEDGHQDPRRVPWGVSVGAERDYDGQPTHLRVERTQGSHVAQSDADWLWELIRRCR